MVFCFVASYFFLAAMENRVAGLLSKKKNGGPLFISCFYPDFDQLVLYTWAVNHGFLLEASLGYYINPACISAPWDFILKGKTESPAISGRFDCGSRCHHRRSNTAPFPYVALLLAFSFGLYGLSKRTSLPSAIGLTLKHSWLCHCIGVFAVQRTCSASGCESGGTWLLLFCRCVAALRSYCCRKEQKQPHISSRYLTIYCANHYPADRAVCLPWAIFQARRLLHSSCIWAALLLLFTFSQWSGNRRQAKALWLFQLMHILCIIISCM